MKKGFSLIEVVVALAMLALIAVPALGLATMVANRNKTIMTTGDASELKRRVDAAVRSYTSAGDDIFSWTLSQTLNSKTFYASEDLVYIESTEAALPSGVAYYTVNLRSPVGYSFDNDKDSYRMITYEITWTSAEANEQSQLLFTSIFRK